MAKDEHNTFVPGATKAEGGGAILCGDITTVAENAVIARGDTLLDTYAAESDAIGGGTGSVWRVRHKDWNVDLAMKRLNSALLKTREQVAAFTRACEAWLNLGLHPNIVSCYYVCDIYGVPAIFSEWMDGGSLEGAIEKGTLYAGTEAEQRERMPGENISSGAMGLCVFSPDGNCFAERRLWEISYEYFYVGNDPQTNSRSPGNEKRILGLFGKRR